MTPGLQKSSIVSNKMYTSVIGKNKNSCEYQKYVTYRNTFNKLKRNAKFQYYKDRILKCKNNSSKLWQVINSIAGKHTNKAILPDCITNEGIKIHNRKDMCQLFCKYFTTVGINLGHKITASTHNLTHYEPEASDSNLYMTPTVIHEIHTSQVD